jgi:hypothetical protein
MGPQTSQLEQRPAVLAEEKQDFQVRALQQGPEQALGPRRLARREQLRGRRGWWEMPVQSQREEQAQAPQRRHCSLPNRPHRVPLSVS